MSIKIASFALAALFSVAQCTAQPEIQARRLAAHTRFLSSDLLEGRGVGDRSGQLAEEYLAATLASFGVAPAGVNGTYFQKVPMVGVAIDSSATLSVSAPGKPGIGFVWKDDFVGTTHRQQPRTDFDGELVFAGHGIVAPEENWNDFKGMDLKGKVLVVFTNEPQPDNPQVFKGKTLTYKGRWTYKYEEAARQGALGCIIIHTTPTAGYGWEVVRNSWSKEDPQMRAKPGEHQLAFAGWVTQEAGERLLKLAGRGVDELLKAADSRDFRPIPLGLRIKGSLTAKLRDIESRNVIGRIEGSDPKLKDEAVVFSAHWDHLGRGIAVNGDDIYNGAVDNATGCAIVLETARAWSELQRKPRRSALFLFVTAEESGLRGSEWFGLNPTLPANKLALNLNYDALYPIGRTSDVVVTGAERTTAWPLVQDAARRYSLEIQPDPRPEQGSYYRSDHFSLAKVGVPAFSIKMGSRVVGKPEGYSADYFREYNTRQYHQPSDEYREDWDFTGMEHAARFGMLIGLNAANSDQFFTWQPGDEFLSMRKP